MYNVVAKKVHVRYLISWWVSCFYLRYKIIWRILRCCSMYPSSGDVGLVFKTPIATFHYIFFIPIGYTANPHNQIIARVRTLAGHLCFYPSGARWVHNRRQEALWFPVVRLSVRCPLTFYFARHVVEGFQWNLSHEWTSPRMFSRSEVKGQGHSETKCPFQAVAYVSTSVYSILPSIVWEKSEVLGELLLWVWGLVPTFFSNITDT